MRLWAAFHHLQALYVAIANLHEPSADMVVMTERGVGVIELKHHAGEITIGADETWYASGHAIRAGNHPNPHRQVQAYGEAIRKRILQLILPASLRTTPASWDDFKFQTTVCFTHPEARVDTVRKLVAQSSPVRRKPWESDFSVTIPDDVAQWAAGLRFQVDMGPRRRFEPYHLAASTVVNVTELLLGATEWSEILELMPTGKPYAFLELLENGRTVQTYGLQKDAEVIGRDPGQCDVVIPSSYSRVSRVQARVSRSVDSVLIENLSARGTTFRSGSRITGGVRLSHEQTITLGGAGAGEKVCELRFLLAELAAGDYGPTEGSNGTA